MTRKGISPSRKTSVVSATSTLRVRKVEPRLELRGAKVGLSACWEIQDLPGLKVQRLRPWGRTRRTPVWTIRHNDLHAYNRRMRTIDEMIEMHGRTWWEDEQIEELTERFQEIVDNKDAAMQAALFFDQVEFASLQEALHTVEGWLLSHGLL